MKLGSRLELFEKVILNDCIINRSVKRIIIFIVIKTASPVSSYFASVKHAIL